VEIIRETTKWDTDTPNHTYMLEKDKMVAYIKVGTTAPIYFSKPLRFEKKNRTFDTLKTNPFA